MALRNFTGTITIGSAAATSGTLGLKGATSGHLMMPDAFSGTVLNFATSPDGQTFRPLYNSAGIVAPAASVAGSRAYPLPSELFGAHSFYLSAGTVQAAARTFVVFLKGGD